MVGALQRWYRVVTQRFDAGVLLPEDTIRPTGNSSLFGGIVNLGVFVELVSGWKVDLRLLKVGSKATRAGMT